MKAAFWALAALLTALPARAEPALTIHVSDTLLGRLLMPEGQEVCLHWAHSVTGGGVADCFENRAGQLTLTRAYLHDFAAGLGEVAGRGWLTQAMGGGYWIEGIDEPLPGNRLTLRIGPARVAHRLDTPGASIPLSELAPGARAILSLSAE